MRRSCLRSSGLLDPHGAPCQGDDGAHSSPGRRWMNDGLLAHHAALLTASAISDEVASARGYRSVERKARLTELGFSVRQARVPALLIPVWSVAGNVALYQSRADE